MLVEVEDILRTTSDLDRDEREVDIREAARKLLERQFVFADDHKLKRVYDTVRRHASFFRSYFEVAGFNLLVEPSEQMVGIVGMEGIRGRQMTLEETMVMLAMRILFEEKVLKGDVREHGRCETTLSELFAMISQTTSRAMIPRTRCRDLVGLFAKNGIARIKEDLEEGDAVVEIRPAILHALAAATVDSLKRYSIADSGAVPEAATANTADAADGIE